MRGTLVGATQARSARAGINRRLWKVSTPPKARPKMFLVKAKSRIGIYLAKKRDWGSQISDAGPFIVNNSAGQQWDPTADADRGHAEFVGWPWRRRLNSGNGLGRKRWIVNHMTLGTRMMRKLADVADEIATRLCRRESRDSVRALTSRAYGRRGERARQPP